MKCWYGESRVTPPNQPWSGRCHCGGTVHYRGIGKFPMQCDECRINKVRTRARDYARRMRQLKAEARQNEERNG